MARRLTLGLLVVVPIALSIVVLYYIFTFRVPFGG